MKLLWATIYALLLACYLIRCDGVEMVTRDFEIGLGKGTGLTLAWYEPQVNRRGGREKIIEGLAKVVYKPRENMLSRS